MMTNIIATLTGGDLCYWEDTVIINNSSGELRYSTQRIKNMILIDIKLTPKTSTDFYTFNAPTQFYFNYYDYRFGFVGRAKEIGICNIGSDKITLDFSTNPTIDEEYHFTQTIALNHT